MCSFQMNVSKHIGYEVIITYYINITGDRLGLGLEIIPSIVTWDLNILLNLNIRLNLMSTNF